MSTPRLATLTLLAALTGCVAYVPVAQPVAVSTTGTQCAAGFYVCPVSPAPVGSTCSCPGLGAPSFGTVR